MRGAEARPVQASLDEVAQAQKVRDVSGRPWFYQIGRGTWTDAPNAERAKETFPDRESLEAAHGPLVEVAPRQTPLVPWLTWGERLSDGRIDLVTAPSRGSWRWGAAEKTATVAEIADLVATLVAEPETVKEAPPEFKGERWKAFVQDVVDLLAKHFGGERRSGVYWAEGAEAFCVRIGPTPQPAGRADGGIWAPVDPEIEWGDPLPDPGDVLVAVKERPRVPKGTLGLIRGVAADGTVLVSWSVDSATEVVRLENGYVAVPSGVDVSGVPREEVFPTGRRARLPFVVEGERRDLPVRVFVWRPGGNPGPKERRNP